MRASQGIIPLSLPLAAVASVINRSPDNEAISAKSPWISLGCYTDNNPSRALSYAATVPGGTASMTNEECQTACQAAGYTMAGTEYGGECCKYPQFSGAIPTHLIDIYKGVTRPLVAVVVPHQMAMQVATCPVRETKARPAEDRIASQYSVSRQAAEMPRQEQGSAVLRTITTIPTATHHLPTCSRATTKYPGHTTGGIHPGDLMPSSNCKF